MPEGCGKQAEREWGRDSDLWENVAERKYVETKREEWGKVREQKRKKVEEWWRRSQVLVFCSMARVSLTRTVVWVCVERRIFTSVSGDGGLWRAALSHPWGAPDVCPSSPAHDLHMLALCPNPRRWHHQRSLDRRWCGHRRRLYWPWCHRRSGWYHRLSGWGQSRHPSAGTRSQRPVGWWGSGRGGRSREAVWLWEGGRCESG